MADDARSSDDAHLSDAHHSSDAHPPDDAATDAAPLAAVVPKPESETALAGLREAGWYDADRSVREHDEGTVAIPISEPPDPDRRADLGVLEVVRQPDPDRRTRDLADLLRERGWSDGDLAAAPASWAVVGTVVLVDVPPDCPDEGAVGEALLDLHREADTVLAREGIEGRTREPHRRVIAGLGDTETVHAEHGVRYALDLAEVMFSPGNEAERARAGGLVAASLDAGTTVATLDGAPAADAGTGADAVSDWIPDRIPDQIPELDPAAGDELSTVGGPTEHVFDMFAGAGYFTLPVAIAGATVTAAEIDPDTFEYLIENAQLNGVGDRVSAYLADCREVAAFVDADRVIMGHYDALEYLDAAFAAVRDGGVIHAHAVVPDAELWDRPRDRLETAATAAGRSVTIEDERRVKSYGEGVWHVVGDVRVD